MWMLMVEISVVEEQKRKYLQDGSTYVPFGWKGLPISMENPYFVDQSRNPGEYHRKLENLKYQIQGMTEEQFRLGEDSWAEIYREYSGDIGWNGIFQAVEEVILSGTTKSMKSLRIKQIGESLYHISNRVRYFFEIASQWGTWNLLIQHAIHSKGLEYPEEIISFISEELCFYKYAPLPSSNDWPQCMNNYLMFQY